MSEVWKTIEDFPDYAVSNLGRVKRIDSRQVHQSTSGPTKSVRP